MNVLDWLLREGWIVVSWWMLAMLAGAAALPLCFRLLRALPDWGYTFARAAGLLLVGGVFWLLASLGFLRNDTGNMVLAWLIVLGISVYAYMRATPQIDLRLWWRENRGLVVPTEILFAVLLFGWALYRAHQNNLTGTEKPMELMMMSAVARSDTFPPNDAWMSGYAISYYYLGYVLSAMFSMLSGIPSTSGFNMTISLLFALTGLGAFGVGYNLVRARAHFDAEHLRWIAPRTAALGAGILALVFVVLLGNFELPLLEIPYQSGAPEGYLRFWGVDERQMPLGEANGLDPAAWGHWWWFRASRVLNDLDLASRPIEVIDEFPAFSFLLADVHPHVLALPFVMLAMGVALNIILSNSAPTIPQMVFYAIVLGGLGFLNTWDAPIYLLLCIAAEAVRRMIRRGTGRLSWDDANSLIVFGGILLGLGLLLYLPFWLGFRSQAGGLLPNVINPTSTPQLILMFGPFLLLLPPFLIVEAWRGGERTNWRYGLLFTLAILALLIVAALGLVFVGLNIPALRNEALRFIEEAGGLSAVLPMILSRRLETLLTLLLLLAGLVLIAARLLPRSESKKKHGEDAPLPDRNAVTYPPSTAFALLLAGVGILLVLTPEFVYLRDNFGTRMNTIFKFYYQAWLLFGVAAGYGVYTLLAETRLPKISPAARAVVTVVLAVVLGLGLLYPIMGVYTRSWIENGRLFSSQSAALTLDGGATFVSLDDYEAIQCFNQLVDSDDLVVAEAIGPAYRSEYGRVAALSGVPILLGWENHENQWRGATYGAAAGSRPSDIPTLYQDPRWETAQEIINRYGIDYIFFGASERNAYGVGGEDKFRDNLEVVCERGASRFYRVNTPQLAAG